MIGLCSVTFRDKKPEEIVQIAKEAGVEAIEWGSDSHVPAGELDTALYVAELTKKAGLTTSSYGTYYRIGTKENIEAYIETAEQLGTKMLRVWAGDKGSQETNDEGVQRIVEETERIAEVAKEKGISLSFEYHAGTLTDTPESAQRLMEAIKAPNVYFYWQPAETLTFEERISSLEILGKWITNVHVFHWEHYRNRFTLQEGEKEWEQYIKKIQSRSSNPQHFLLEFVKDNSPDQFKQDAQTLKEIIKKATLHQTV